MKKRIALVTGGYSSEAQISYKSAITVGNNLDFQLFDVYKIDISKAGWWHIDIKDESAKDGYLSAVNKADFSIEVDGNKIFFDAVLLCIHGTPGEDGKLQGYFDMLKLPYTGCNSATAALTFNKRFTVATVAFDGIDVAKSIYLSENSIASRDEVIEKLSFPFFVKPNNGGSSFGISKVKDVADLDNALTKAFKEDNQVIVEEQIIGKEFTVGVFKNKEEIIVLPITEIISETEFFDFEAKYLGKSKEITPAEIEENVAYKLESAARKIYNLLNCEGVVRIDFIYNESEGKPYMLEVNTVPGQSAASIIPQQVKAMGWELKHFYTALIQSCFV